MPTSPKKLVILGGGVGAMSTAFEITNNPNWRDLYESITVYQMGWRIGGKGASGRREPYGAIEEHGLHIWLGFYNNAFDAIQRAYKELGRPAGAPLATWQDAFKNHNQVVFAQKFQGKWHPWNFDFPEKPSIPGKSGPLPTLWDNIGRTMRWVKKLIKKPEYKHYLNSGSASPEYYSYAQDQLKAIVKVGNLNVDLGSRSLAEDIVNVIIAHIQSMGEDLNAHTKADHATLLNLLQLKKAWLTEELLPKVDSDLILTRFFILLDTGLTVLKGLIADGVLFHPVKLDYLDKYDLREWFLRHGAEDLTTNHSPIMKGFYDLVFAYENGEEKKPNFAAGTAIRCIFRIVFTYKGSIFWKMQAGMGDTIFTPLHDVLRKRGVTFKFFHKVKNLGASADGKSISTISIGRQATVKDGKDYEPYVTIKRLDCWPSEPDYKQLVEGEALKNGEINLESFYTPWKDVEEIKLQAGKDFDEVLFGISLEPVRYICPELLIANEKWQVMIDNVRTVRTMAFQAWLHKDLGELGWDKESPVMDAFKDPMNTWADMSQLIERENWPVSSNIKNISYFCGPMEDDVPESTNVDVPGITHEKVAKVSRDFMNNDIKAFWPNAVDSQGNFDWSIVEGGEKGLFCRANIDPSERYVLSVKGSTKYRLNGGDSGFSNLYLAGDWTLCGLNAGCVEAAVISGMLASNAMTGYPALTTIDGYQDI